MKKPDLITNSTTNFIQNRWESERKKILKKSKRVNEKLKEIQKNYEMNQKKYSEYLEKGSTN
jgi:hypothetical protein